MLHSAFLPVRFSFLVPCKKTCYNAGSKKNGCVSMPLSEFYLMNDEQIASLHEQLAENFYDDDLYRQYSWMTEPI